MRLRRLAAIIVGAGLLGGCSDGNGPSSSDEVDFTIEGLPAGSPSSGHYELWISFFEPTPARHEAGVVSCGKFRVDEAGGVVGLDGGAIRFAVTGLSDEQRDENGEPIWVWAQDAFVTLEAEGDSDDEPSFPGFLGGSFLNGRAGLTIGHADALRSDFLSAAGAALLATPSTSDTSDEAQGVWFTETGAVASALTLPALGDTVDSEGWIYEGWVELTSPASLGRFLDPAAPDDDGSLFPGDQPGWGFPGSDYPYGLIPHPDLAGSIVFVTIEPASGADGPGPFRALTILSGKIPAGWLGPHVTLANTARRDPRDTLKTH